MLKNQDSHTNGIQVHSACGVARSCRQLSAPSQQLLHRFLRFLHYERNASPHTQRMYHDALTRFLRFIHSVHPRHVSTQEIRRFLVSEHQRGLSLRSVAQKLHTVRSFFRFLGQEEIVLKNPAALVPAPRYAKRLPAFLDEQQVKRLLQAPLLPTWEQLRDHAVLVVLYSTGIRVAELASLNLDDFDEASGTIRVIGKGDKERHVPISAMAVRAIRSYLARRPHVVNDPKAVFVSARAGCRLVVRDIDRLVRRYAEQMQLPLPVTPHTLRHTFASHLLDHDADLISIKEMLGHANVATTAHYTHVTPQRMFKVYAQAHPRA